MHCSFTSFSDKENQQVMDPSKTGGRRLFLKCLSLLGITVAGGSGMQLAFSGCESDKKKSSNDSIIFDITLEQSLSTVGRAAKVSIPELNNGKPVLMIRTTGESFVVLSTVCQHLGCEVNLPDKAGGTIECPCHGSQYSAEDGRVLRGPTQAPLKQFISSFSPSKNNLTIWF